MAPIALHSSRLKDQTAGDYFSLVNIGAEQDFIQEI